MSDVGKIKVTLHPDARGYARFKSFGFTDQRFRDYRAATEGAMYVRELKAKLVPIERVPAMLVRLTKAGFRYEASEDLKHELRKRSAQEWLEKIALYQRIDEIDAELFARTGNRIFPYQRTGIVWLMRMYGALLADEMGTGKASSSDEPVLTPAGWKRIGDVRVGDEVIGSDGRPTRVLGVYPQGRVPLYRVTLNDDCSTVVSGDHLWYVHTPNTRFRGTAGRVMSTHALLAAGLHSEPSGDRERGNARWFVPVVAPVSFTLKTFDLHPYALGALIANGSFTGHTVCHDGGSDQRDLLAAHLPEGFELRRLNDVRSSICIVDGGSGFTRRHLEPLGLVGKLSPEKRVPPEYLRGSIEQRLALLQGLMDNDGTVAKDGIVVEYNTTSPDLGADVLELVRSLGGTAQMSTREPKYMYKGEKLTGKTDHRIRFSLPEGLVPFRLPRKVERFKPRTKYPPAHSIERIEACGEGEAVCIRVEAADHLYVTRDYILTHNTLQALISIPANVPVIIVAPSVAKGDWRSQMCMWRPGLEGEVLSGRTSFYWPAAGRYVLTNYQILRDIHDREGVRGRKCDSKLPAVPCPGCKTRIVFVGEMKPGLPPPQPMEVTDGHTKECADRKFMQKRKDCPGCHPFLDDCPANVVIILDEAHMIKNRKAEWTRRARALCRAIRRRGGRVWLLTGTPIENKPPEIWALAQAAGCAEDAFGSFNDFVELFKGVKLEYGGFEWGLPDDGVKEHLKRFMLRRLKSDVLPDLPEKLRSPPQIVELDARTMKRVDELLRASGMTVDRVVELLSTEEVGFENMSAVRAALARAKVPAMLEYLSTFETQGVPLIVFSAHRAPIDELRDRSGWVVITGDENPEEKTRAADAFQHGWVADENERHIVDRTGSRRLSGLPDRREDPSKPCEHVYQPHRLGGVCEVCGVVFPVGIGITIASGGVSLTLTRAGHELFVDKPWKPTALAQAEDRAVRIGQTKGVVIGSLVARHPLDERVNAVLDQKMKLITASVDAAADASQAVVTIQDLFRQEREEQEAIAFGRAVRRPPITAEERAALEGLYTFVFSTRSDERFAADLAEQYETLFGLSEKQWAHAVLVVARGRLKGATSESRSDEKRGASPISPPPTSSPSPSPSSASPSPSSASGPNRRRSRWGDRQGRRP